MDTVGTYEYHKELAMKWIRKADKRKNPQVAEADRVTALHHLFLATEAKKKSN